jgi:hypothetical protein
LSVPLAGSRLRIGALLCRFDLLLLLLPTSNLIGIFSDQCPFSFSEIDVACVRILGRDARHQ